MNRKVWVAAAVCALSTATATSPPPALSQYAPLSVSRLSTFGENLIESEVHHSLLQLPFFGVFDHLAYTVNGNIVVLSGSVMNPTLRDDAAAVGQTVEGVACVANMITFLPNSPSDNRIRLQILSAIYGPPGLRQYAFVGRGGAIHIIVDRGRVTLEGEVASAGDIRKVAERAASVQGVLAVTSHLTIGY